MRDVRVQDVLLESVVTLVNITARRIGKEDERDLEQAKVGIDAVRAVVDLLEPEPRAQVQNALSELQVLYAKHAGGEDAAPAEGDDAGQQPPQPQQPRPQPQKRGGPGGPGGLWTPPGT